MIDCGNTKYVHPFHAAKVPYYNQIKIQIKGKERNPKERPGKWLVKKCNQRSAITDFLTVDE